ncbi:MAG: DUF2304 domain-containing protein [Candidatus Schekmanbacteria bacterium]|nr:DUF2304 domain-containing protein [Candidatus Schekmanbacteria bacterium]
MPFRQKIVAILISLFILGIIIELVRRRKLREEYSWLWLLTGVTLLVFSVWYDLLVAITHLIGAVLPTSTLFFFGLIFLILINLHYSLKISQLTNQVKNLAQKIALLEIKDKK